MKANYRKATVAVFWVLAVCAGALVAHVTSVAGWTMVAALAVLPPSGMTALWNEPPQSLSESIHEVLR